MTNLTKWTVEDYHRMIDTGIIKNRQVELINEEIINMIPEEPIHRFINHRAVKYLRYILGNQAEVMEAHPITLVDSEPEPDITVVHSPDTLYLDRHPYSEDIYCIIEIADSTLQKDLGTKKTLYANSGIEEYWVIDVAKKNLKVFRNLMNNQYQIEQNYQDEVIFIMAFPSVEISVQKLIGFDEKD
ncbi:MAG: Uma2 family endonuclease [Okeania sp. SIO2G4]|uniref:Uma2 family endonuclease n=1 Tax=unclassified Okeania TaxID=2634635 RepID=UPI0013BE2588|nr:MULTISPECIES: Uma2 family endonuclease [unclassified Okeania]NEP74241.1 Uma2 family endonuclease [Okeania sp. SIO2G5]NEP95816.1 Uma2 family endonuclease [Okeania sp. SIO2F5]NEQ92686.1 Uma2 family endonuclease [Okeania sp. SIO2G4]